MSLDPAELRVLDAAKLCCERWGLAKVTIEDIANEAGVSRATLYRMFPGGKDILFEALRVRELEDFFTRLSAHLEGAVDFEDLLVLDPDVLVVPGSDDPNELGGTAKLVVSFLFFFCFLFVFLLFGKFEVF